jgi:uncharacterized membrane protein YsdA (DUF1294 family)/cold shock CspA family protein
MRLKGRITEWNDPRGFGFVTALKGGQRVFVHVSAFPIGSRRPTEGEFVSYTLDADERGRPCATEVTYAWSDAPQPDELTQAEKATVHAVAVAVTFVGILVLLVILGRLWWPVPCIYIITSIAAHYAYKQDKAAAQAGTQRTNEWGLISLGLIGGWPGALIARHQFRHKTKKVAFRVGYWLSVALNVAALAWFVAELNHVTIIK